MTNAACLMFHGAIILFIGMLLGFPFAKNIAKSLAKKSGHTGHDPWKMAHTAICAAATLMIALAGSYQLIHLSPALEKAFVSSIIASAYAFTAGVTLGGITGHRGFLPQGPLANWVVLACNFTGVAGSMVGGVLLIAGTI